MRWDTIEGFEDYYSQQEREMLQAIQKKATFLLKRRYISTLRYQILPGEAWARSQVQEWLLEKSTVPLTLAVSDLTKIMSLKAADVPASLWEPSALMSAPYLEKSALLTMRMVHVCIYNISLEFEI